MNTEKSNSITIMCIINLYKINIYKHKITRLTNDLNIFFNNISKGYPN